MIPYSVVVTVLLAVWLYALFGLRETIPDYVAPRESYHVFKPFLQLREKQLRTITLIATCTMLTNVLAVSFHSLFVLETLGFSAAVLGQSSGVRLALTIALTFPAGWLVDRFDVKPILLVGYAWYAVTIIAVGWLVQDVTSLYVFWALNAVGNALVVVTTAPLVFGNTPAERRGIVYGTVRATNSIVVTIAVIGIGGVADLMDNNYRVFYLFSGACALLGFIVVCFFNANRKLSSELV